jgi:hypothetical protein
MTPLISLSRALSDVHLLGSAFESPSFWTWKTLAKVIDGEPLREQREMELFRECTGRLQAVPPFSTKQLLMGPRQSVERGNRLWLLCHEKY